MKYTRCNVLGSKYLLLSVVFSLLAAACHGSEASKTEDGAEQAAMSKGGAAQPAAGDQQQAASANTVGNKNIQPATAAGTTTNAQPAAQNNQAPPTELWNDQAIHWLSYNEGMAAAKESNKPVLLLIYTNWCPQCRRYSQVFADSEVVKRTSNFVMIRLDQDANKEIAGKYVPDGGYIPRTLFLTPNGDVRADLVSGNARFKHFLNNRAPTELLALMDRAVQKP